MLPWDTGACPGTIKLKMGCLRRYSVSEVREAVPDALSAHSWITYTAWGGCHSDGEHEGSKVTHGSHRISCYEVGC